ncbi:hypothetical protein O6H91_16G032000 [Diphasiastrum complanatum]|uniref:Uncharacterized protein n=1 Tax=Diphasiastrum complanatum TaxID=34168 RepID=A0ACC2BBB8_DIPCM|nr:hypothetical protein O6H91_16G032000 [Diphasiastrum complanatum]
MAVKRALPINKRPLDIAFIAFFVLSLLIFLVVHSQAVCPGWLFPRFMKNIVRARIKYAGDFLMRDKPRFFQGIVLAEIFVQIPLILANIYAFYYGKGWGRMTGIVYGVHSASIMVPVIFEIFYARNVHMKKVLFYYMTYVVVPLLILVRVLPRDYPFDRPFPFLNFKRESRSKRYQKAC